MATKAKDLKAQVLRAALDCTKGDFDRTFTFEELLVAAWKRNPVAWGLRGFEREHPDAERLHRELDSRGRGSAGLVDQGVFEKIETRVYRLTTRGVEAAAGTDPNDRVTRETIDRKTEDAVRKVLEHAVFREWLRDPSRPRKFRDAGHFWGIAPGTPRAVVRQRIQQVEDTIDSARSLLDRRGIVEISGSNGRLLFDRTDLERCSEFQTALRQRFAAELESLGFDSMNDADRKR